MPSLPHIRLKFFVLLLFNACLLFDAFVKHYRYCIRVKLNVTLYSLTNNAVNLLSSCFVVVLQKPDAGY